MVRRKKKAKILPKRIKSWSYSTWATYDECQGKAKFSRIDKLPDPPGPAAQRGNEVHDTCERFVLQHIEHGFTSEVLEDPLDTWADDFDELIEILRAADEYWIEEKWAFDKDWEETEWFAKDAWCRAKMDVAWRNKLTANFIDYKTGRIRDKHDEQANLYAVCCYVKIPNIRSVRGAYWYLDEDVIQPYEYDIEALKILYETWNRRGLEITTATQFPFTPGRHCSWCAFAASKGGPCRHG